MLQIETTTQAFEGLGPVSDVQLKMERVRENTNILSVSFLHELGNVWRLVDFLFRPLPTKSAVHLEALLCTGAAKKVFTVADVYPLNGTVKNRRFKITDFVRPIHRKEIQQQVEILDEIDCEKEHVRCLVIDFKDQTKRYDCLQEISVAEKEFAAFFKGDGSYKDKTQVDIYNLIRKGKVNFFINEGSLKAGLIKRAFNSEQSDFFQKNEKGSRLLCQLCEVIMNGFKQGCEFVVNEHRFNPNDYITVVSNIIDDGEGGDCEELELPPIRLLTLYPNYYQGTYSLNSAYYRLITNIFRTRHEDKNGTTIITIE